MTVLGFLGAVSLLVGLGSICMAAHLWLKHRAGRQRMPRGYLKPWA